MTQLEKKSGTTIARPLRVLVPLIKDDLQRAREAAERAGLPYFRDAGEKLLEAKEQLAHGEFLPWVKRNFALSMETAKHYMRLAEHAAEHAAEQNGSALPFSSLSDFIRKTSNPNYNLPHTVRPPTWHEPVKKIVERVDTDTLNLAREELKRADEREAQRKLALQLIDIGYKVLAQELHPDKGGSRDAMTRLNHVRDRLKQCAERSI
jgi:hypothetical protein